MIAAIRLATLDNFDLNELPSEVSAKLYLLIKYFGNHGEFEGSRQVNKFKGDRGGR